MWRNKKKEKRLVSLKTLNWAIEHSKNDPRIIYIDQDGYSWNRINNSHTIVEWKIILFEEALNKLI